MKLPVCAMTLVVALTIFTTAFAADPIYPGGPTVGDINRENFKNFLIARQKAAVATAEFNEDLRKSRERFFTTSPKSAQHKAAETDFANKLQGKDFLFLGPCISNGFKDGYMRMMGVGVLSAGQQTFDGGIPNSAIPAYAAWVNAIRKSLGARSESELLMAALDSDKVAAAVEANVESYAKYKRERDKSEFVQWSRANPTYREVSGPPPAEDFAVVKLRLEHPAVYLLRYLDPKLLPVHSGVGKEVEPANQQVLVCIYSATTTASYPRLNPRRYYWYKSVPTNIEHLHDIDMKNFKGLAATPDTAYESCPDSAEASRDQFEKENSFYGPTNLTFADEQALYLNVACHAAAVQTLKEEEGPHKAHIANELQQRYVKACAADKKNLTSTSVSADMNAMCSSWNSELARVRQSRPSPLSNDAATLASYDRQCAGATVSPALATTQPASPSSSTAGPGGTRPASSSPSSSSSQNAAQDAHARQCAQMYANLDSARAHASGLRALIGLKGMESRIYRECGSRP